ncbi:MAG: hypothetical protein KF833_17975, partial [Verrucomicrobiae bacterium]|nr:hypothetical protein [Verrucomicrobiae bacterium]
WLGDVGQGAGCQPWGTGLQEDGRGEASTVTVVGLLTMFAAYTVPHGRRVAAVPETRVTHGNRPASVEVCDRRGRASMGNGR